MTDKPTKQKDYTSPALAGAGDYNKQTRGPLSKGDSRTGSKFRFVALYDQIPFNCTSRPMLCTSKYWNSNKTSGGLFLHSQKTSLSPASNLPCPSLEPVDDQFTVQV